MAWDHCCTRRCRLSSTLASHSIHSVHSIFSSSCLPVTPSPRLALRPQRSLCSCVACPVALRPDFVLVRSEAMVYHGSRRRPRDLDIVGTPTALWAFLEGAQEDGRFSVMLKGRRLILFLSIISKLPCNCIFTSKHLVYRHSRRWRRYYHFDRFNRTWERSVSGAEIYAHGFPRGLGGLDARPLADEGESLR
ncbi:hypothetical protein BU23DRAFT_74267 [Bimuria novae-zelandiae CBS 107.79]|uniref:Uncharacterized protein n=1 Tax=Bimuria novae-zelandiae CBS 107.79 TaxID=1447943 RepID=A0A6A5VD90_9PLEO|nr:hypothetical protein BU23DRAFT_74267 [Bimuria novae-zelandiae CBS 107.79]